MDAIGPMISKPVLSLFGAIGSITKKGDQFFSMDFQIYLIAFVFFLGYFSYCFTAFAIQKRPLLYSRLSGYNR